MVDMSIELVRSNFLPGEIVRGRLVVNVPKAQEIGRLYMRLHGEERTDITIVDDDDGPDLAESESVPIIDQWMSLWSRGVAQSGLYHLDFELKLPHGILPSYYGQNAKVQYILEACMDVPWGLDVRRSMFVNVLPSGQDLRPRPLEANFGYPAGHGPSIERGGDKATPGMFLRMDRTTVQPGESIGCELWVHNPLKKDIRQIEIYLRAVENARAKRYSDTYEISMKRWVISFDRSKENKAIPFQIPISRDAIVSYKGHLSRLDYELMFNLDVAWGFDTSGKVIFWVGL